MAGERIEPAARHGGGLPVSDGRRVRRRPAGTDEVDAASLERALRRSLRGEVMFDAGNRAVYAHDSSNYGQPPIGVVLPRDADDILAALAACRDHGAPVLPRGCGTSLAGQACNVAVVIDTSKHMRRVVEIDAERRFARVEPGVVRDALTRLTEARHDLTFGPDTATHGWATLGGMVGNDSCGMHSVMAGRTSDNVEELEVVTYDGVRMRVGPTSEEELERIVRAGGRRGEIYARMRDLRDRHAGLIRERFPDIPRRVSGYGLDALLPENGFDVARALTGSEGTLATVLEAKLRLVHMPPWRTLLVLGYPTMADGADGLSEILGHTPLALEAIDARLVQNLQRKGIQLEEIALLPEGGGWLLVEFGGETSDEAEERARGAMADLAKASILPLMKLFDDPAEAARVWRVREGALAATAAVPGEPDHWEGWEDAAVPPGREGDYLRDFERLLDRYDYDSAFYGHFGQGCIHTRINFDLRTQGGIAKWRTFLDEAAELVLAYGGSLSGEHGDGQSRAELLPKMFGLELVEAFGELKAVWDPDGRMNPHKIVDPYPIVSNLKLGVGHAPPEPKTHFAYRDDDGSFARATQRCVGAGKCRETNLGTMCPSYMVTLDEQHSTRGRARILFEMLEGETIAEGFRSEEVHAALDLCLSCKGCKGECPVQVDMASYKAEFLSKHYKGQLRPRAAYSMGLIMLHARVAARAPRLANALTRAPVVGDLVKRAGGISPKRELPHFAEETFLAWWKARAPVNPGAEPVVLFPDTFSNFLRPAPAKAAVAVLEAAGRRVVVPEGALCCGRPLYDHGMLDTAKLFWRRTLRVLGSCLDAGWPIVGVEPSCVAAFRDELPGLLSDDDDAQRLSARVQTLSEFLAEHAPGWPPPRLERRALVHGHCHQEAVMGISAEKRLLARMGVDFEVLDSGCCGMAGGFGFERDHYEVSVRVGEHRLAPRVRAAAEETLLIADGFSCRTQVEDLTGRTALHTAEVIGMALEEGADRRLEAQREPSPAGPEAARGRGEPRVARLPALVALASLGAGAALAARRQWRRR